jgi:hypothetical protein
MKRIFRTWLRKWCWKNTPAGEYKMAYNWIYDSKLSDWPLRMWCVKNHVKGIGMIMTYQHTYDWIKSGEETHRDENPT